MLNRVHLIYAVILAVAVFGLYFLNVRYSKSSQFLYLLATYLVVLAIAYLSKLSLQDMGLSTSSLVSGLKLALPFMALIVVGATVAYFVKPDLFSDSRYSYSQGQLIIKLIVLVPLATVLIEELIFRGLLLGLFNSVLSTVLSVAISSALFGLWHLFSAGGVDVGASRTISIIGVVLVTTLAGVFFSWLRLKSGSLIAPILVHWTFNSTGVMLAYLAVRSGAA